MKREHDKHSMFADVLGLDVCRLRSEYIVGGHNKAAERSYVQGF